MQQFKQFLRLIWADIALTKSDVFRILMTSLVTTTCLLFLIGGIATILSWFTDKPFNSDAMSAGFGVLMCLAIIGVVVAYLIKKWKGAGKC